MSNAINILIAGAKRRAREGAPYAPSFKARPVPGNISSRNFWTLRALFLEHVKIYNNNGWRKIWRGA